MRILRSRRAVSNIVATMIIFALMSVAMALLYSQISPTIIGFQAESQAANQEFIFLTVQSEVEKLITMPEDSRSQVHIISNGAVYDLEANAYSLGITYSDGPNSGTLSEALGSLSAQIDESFQTAAETRYLGSYVVEDTYFNTENTRDAVSSVAVMSISRSSATINLYIRAQVSLVETSTGNYDLNVYFYKLTVRPSLSFDGFPVDADEWTLKIRRGPSTVNLAVDSFLAASTTLTLTQTLDGDGTGLASDTFTVASIGNSINVNSIIIPLYLSI